MTDQTNTDATMIDDASEQAVSTAATHAAESENIAVTEASATANAAGVGRETKRDGRRRSKQGPRAKRTERTRKERHGHGGDADAATPRYEAPNLAARLLAPIELPKTALDRKLVPPALLAPLDAVGLGTAQHLPAALFMTLAACCAVAGPDVRLASDAAPPAGNAPPLSLRVALLAHDRSLSLVPSPILAGAHAAENDALDAYRAATARQDQQRRLIDRRRRLHEQACHSLAAIGMAEPPALPDDMPDRPTARPRIVVGAASSAIAAAAAGGTGVLVVDERRMASLANVGDHYDVATDGWLNRAALGHQIAVEDNGTGRMMMCTPPACVIGVLTSEECPSLAKATRVQLASTLFVPAAAAPVAGDGTPLLALMRRVHAMGHGLTILRLKDVSALTTAAEAWAVLAAAAKPPLSDYFGGLPDLARRLAAALHLATAAAAPEGELSFDVPPALIKRAVMMVDSYVVATARAVLAPASTTQTERDARRVVAYLRETTSPMHRLFERRVLVRAWQRSMTVPRLDAALALLQEADLLSGLDTGPGKGGTRFEVAPAVFAPV